MGLFKFPFKFSSFVRKKDASYPGDPNGDYVKADDINGLQESIENLERIVDIEALDDTVSNELSNKVSWKDISQFGSPLFVHYMGNTINAYDSIEKRIHDFSYLTHAALNKEESTAFDTFLKAVAGTGTKLYGIIQTKAKTMNEIERLIDWYHGKEFVGISIPDFGFEDGLTREKQNQILDYVHQKSLSAMISGEIETTLFKKDHANNPQQSPLNLDTSDIYLARDIFVSSGVKISSSVISSAVITLNKAQSELGIKIFVEDTTNSDVNSQERFEFGRLLSTLYNLDGYSLAPKSRYSLNEKISQYLYGMDMGTWKSDKPIYVEEGNVVSRSFSRGSISYDKANNKVYVKGVGVPANLVTWQNKQIPGSAVDLARADYNASVIKEMVDAINENEEKIHYSKIDGISDSGMNPDMMKDSVIRAINNSPAALEKNPPDGYEKLAGNDFIHGHLIDYLDASAIKSGHLSIESLSANIIEAVNAYIGHARIDHAFIGNLTADHIQSVVVDAINLYAENAVIDRAFINSAVIPELLTDHMKGNVVEAINLYAGEAKIDAARIGSLTAEYIRAGIVEALEISAASGNFDQLQAAMITAINASVKNAFIDGAIIDKGTIGSVQIAEGSLTDAHIVELSANKIKAGRINTGQVTVEGENGHLQIKNNRLQVFDDQNVPIERVSIGDVDNDGNTYGLRVRGADGKTVLYDENGVYEQGITDGAITNPKIGDGAVENKNIFAGTITGDRLVADTITAREVRTRSLNANVLQVGAITSDSAVIAEGAIGSVEIGKAVIDDGHIRELNADKITAGKIKAEFIQVGPDTDYETGYSPEELREEMKDRIPYKVDVVSTKGTVFKGGNIETTLKAFVYLGIDEVTNELEAKRFSWERVSMDSEADHAWNIKHQGVKEVSITKSDVYQRATFFCKIS